MANSALITTPQRELGLYLHRNGGRYSVEAFLRYCNLKRYPSLSGNPRYGFARLAQVASNFFGGRAHVGIVPYTRDEDMLAGIANGIYVVEGWDILHRLLPYPEYEEEQVDDLIRALHAIDRRQPTNEQLGSIIDSPTVEPGDLDAGDCVWVYTDYRRVDGRYQGGYVPVTVAGIGAGEVIDGTDVDGVPFVELFGDDEDPADRYLSNYLLEPAYRRVI